MHSTWKNGTFFWELVGVMHFWCIGTVEYRPDVLGNARTLCGQDAATAANVLTCRDPVTGTKLP